MAIPDNYIDKITKDGSSRMISPEAGMVRVGNENFESTDLDGVLDEIAQELNDAGDGTVQSVSVCGTKYSPDPNGDVDISDAINTLQSAITSLQNALNTITQDGNVAKAIDTFNEVKAFLEGIKNDDPTLLTTITNLQTAISGLQTALAGKANDNIVVKSISVNGGQAQTPTNGNVNIEVSGVAGKSAYQSYYDTTSDNPKMNETEWVQAILRSAYRSYLATTSDNPKLTESQWVASLKGAKGDTGNVEFEDLADLVALLVNDLTTGGAGNFLSAEMGKRLYQNLNAVQNNIVNLYNKLANLAFLTAQDKAAAEPTELDWSTPKVTITFTNSITGSGYNIKANGVSVNGNFQIYKGDDLKIEVSAQSGYALLDIAAEVDGVSTQMTEVSGVYTLELQNVNAATAIEISGSAGRVITDELTFLPQHNTSAVSSGTPRVYVQKSVNSGGTTISKDNRATLLLKMLQGETTDVWYGYGAGTNSPDKDEETMAAYTLYRIPSGASKITIECGTGYKYYVGFLNNSTHLLVQATSWDDGVSTLIIPSNATHFTFVFKNNDDSDFTGNETVSDLGIEVIIS